MIWMVFKIQVIGDYYVGFEPNADPSNMNYGFTGTNNGNGSNDSDADGNGFTNVFNFDPQNGDNLTIDAGVQVIWVQITTLLEQIRVEIQLQIVMRVSMVRPQSLRLMRPLVVT